MRWDAGWIFCYSVQLLDVHQSLCQQLLGDYSKEGHCGPELLELTAQWLEQGCSIQICEMNGQRGIGPFLCPFSSHSGSNRGSECLLGKQFLILLLMKMDNVWKIDLSDDWLTAFSVKEIFQMGKKGRWTAKRLFPGSGFDSIGRPLGLSFLLCPLSPQTTVSAFGGENGTRGKGVDWGEFPWELWPDPFFSPLLWGLDAPWSQINAFSWSSWCSNSL